MTGWWSRLRGLREAAPAEAPPAPLRILLLADARGATQTISFLRPLAADCAAGECRIEMMDEAELAAAGGPAALAKLCRTLRPNLLVMSRYAGGREAAAVEAVRREGGRVIHHLDDELFAVPAALGPAKFARYNDPRRLAALTAAVEAADLVYASTPELARRLRERFPHKPVVAGTIYCAHAPLVERPSATGGPVTIGYMGTSGHAHDVEMVVPHLAALLAAQPDLRFETFGTIAPPPALARFGSRVAHHPPVAGYDAFMDRLAALGWHVGLAPLADDAFNRCKADTKWVEYSAAGIAVLASDLPVYERCCADGAGLLVPADGWPAALARITADAALRSALVGAAQARLRQAYAPGMLREQVRRILLGTP